MRIVSLCPSTTESLVALGLAGSLVGVTRYCVHPREALEGVARVGGTKNPDLAAIAAVEPDLVLANAEENREPDLAELSKKYRVDVSHPTRVADVPPMLRRLGALTGAEVAAEGWAHAVEEKLAAARPGRPVRFAYLIWKGPWMAAAAGTYISDLFETFGGVNVFGGATGPWPETSEDDLTALAPELVVLPDEPYRFGEAEASLWRHRLPAARVALVAGEDLCWHGVRTLRGLDAARSLLSGAG
ncbi:MAG: ABC transporter substrate-binding protein [Thermoanaerobaculia bacterium]|nr:ABC transporter substrate-binding protein [Thermoanaerobaculia bacterium]